MVRPFKIFRYSLVALSLLIFSLSFCIPVSAQLHQPDRASYRASARANNYRLVKQPQLLNPQQRSPKTSEQYLPNPIQSHSLHSQPMGVAVPPTSRPFSENGGHSFHRNHELNETQSLPSYRSLPSNQSQSLYNSPYHSNSANLHQPQNQLGQQLGSTNLPSTSECIDCTKECYNCTSSPWRWQVIPKDLLYKSYLGGPREPRLGQSILHLGGTGTIWSLEAGGRAGLLRYGSGPGEKPEGWQLDVWGAAFPRLNFNEGLELDAVDFKVGVPLTWSKGPYQAKFEWNHISSHLGDEFMLRNPAFPRIDYLRDALVLGGGYFINPDLRIYADAEYAYNTNGGSEPWHFQFGVDYSPVCTEHCNPVQHPHPFFAINGQLRQEANFSGGVNVVAGLQWRGEESNGLFRIGMQYYQGQSLQFEFLNDYEELIGVGMWYDF